MEAAALQPGMTAGLCPYGHTDCVPAADAVAQRIRQLEQQLEEAKQQLNIKDDQLMLQGRQLMLQSEQLISQSDQIRSKDERIKQLSEQSAWPAKTDKQQGKKTTTKKTKAESSFKPWNRAGDACFVLAGARVKFWNGEKLKDLKLRSGSKAHMLLPMLATRALTNKEVKKAICTLKTSPYDAIRNINRMLNDKIKTLNIQEVPPNTAFIARDERTGEYFSTLPIKSYQEFEYD